MNQTVLVQILIPPLIVLTLVSIFVKQQQQQ